MTPASSSDDITDNGGEVVSETTSLNAESNQGINGTASRYVPPHLRNRADGTNTLASAEILKLKRQLKGLLNRVSEQNMETVLDEILGLYRNNRRNDVTTTIAGLIIESISSHSQLLDSFVILHATLVASLHKLIGVDFAAHLVQETITRFEDKYTLAASTTTNNLEEAPDASKNLDAHAASLYSKESTNLIVLISELYNFQVISCTIVYDIIRMLLESEKLTEVSVELVLKMARNSGAQLRTDDPLALKDITEMVLKKVGDGPDGLRQLGQVIHSNFSRLKTGKGKQSHVQANVPGGDSIQRLRKFLSGLAKRRHVVAHEPLNISLADLHSSHKKGKWWLVGAAWAGDPLVEAQERHREQHAAKTTSVEASEASVLLKVARKQGMNTDIRRSIFVVLMSSEDYIDACDRIGQLPLKDSHQSEIIRVLLQCLGNEKSYNPYYTMVGQQLASTAHSSQRFSITLQFCLWDFLRSIGEEEVGGAAVLQNSRESDSGESKAASLTKIQNIASAYAWWTCRGVAELSMLKAVNFVKLKPQGQEFFKTFFIQIFVGAQARAPAASYLSSTSPHIPDTNNNSIILKNLFFDIAEKNASLARGLHYYLRQNHLEREVKTADFKRLLEWSVDVAKQCLKDGLETSAS
ncbi:armadillo-type protein [Cantharellus anzutake]|uniref:armadillo-type protein n=1 Tax=Cantharellus anzutake TaxID=1750568 RepID=UPI001906586A|nr:armadillo-type protein [Cantharellus anzutake]KAF8339977.1 armadillo-type protein [Cantharellus anzutake]